MRGLVYDFIVDNYHGVVELMELLDGFLSICYEWEWSRKTCLVCIYMSYAYG